MYGPTENWRRNFTPSTCLPFSIFHKVASAGVPSLRRLRRFSFIAGLLFSCVSGRGWGWYIYLFFPLPILFLHPFPLFSPLYHSPILIRGGGSPPLRQGRSIGYFCLRPSLASIACVRRLHGVLISRLHEVLSYLSSSPVLGEVPLGGGVITYYPSASVGASVRPGRLAPVCFPSGQLVGRGCIRRRGVPPDKPG